MTRPLSLAGIFLTVLVLACGDPAPGERHASPVPVSTGVLEGARNDLSLSEVYERMLKAITGDGKVFHTQVRVIDVKVIGLDGPQQTAVAAGRGGRDLLIKEMWLDPDADVGRVHVPNRGGAELPDSKRIVRQDQLFRTGAEGRGAVDPLRCRGSNSHLLAQLMLCDNWLEESTTTVMNASYGGRYVVALVTEGKLPSHDWDTPFSGRLYIDPETWLPIAGEEHQDLAGEGRFVSDTVVAYESGFVDRSSLAHDFFEPSAIGY